MNQKVNKEKFKRTNTNTAQTYVSFCMGSTLFGRLPMKLLTRMNLSGLPKFNGEPLDSFLHPASSPTFFDIGYSLFSKTLQALPLLLPDVIIESLDCTRDLTRSASGSDSRVIFVIKLPKLLLTVTVDRCCIHHKNKKENKQYYLQ